MAFNIFKKKNRPDRVEEKVDTASTGPEPEAETATAETIETIQSTETPPLSQETASAPPPSSAGIYQRLRNGLSKTRQILTTDVDQLFRPGQPISPDTLDDLEERLITADIGAITAMDIIERLSDAKVIDTDHFKSMLKDIFLSYLQESQVPEDMSAAAPKPRIVLVVGVNGVGKTTTIGKLAARYIQAGKKVMLVAADTFRAAAIEQLEIWAQRTGADFVKHRENSDPAAVVFDGLEAARARDMDIVLIDTAGRLHTKTNLMEELKKIKRTITKKIPDAPHEVLLVLDATTGQNALSQAEMFVKATGVTGIALTKLDGTAKGGIVVNLCHSFQVPLRFIGVGEQIDDLQSFDPEKFVTALF